VKKLLLLSCIILTGCVEPTSEKKESSPTSGGSTPTLQPVTEHSESPTGSHEDGDEEVSPPTNQDVNDQIITPPPALDEESPVETSLIEVGPVSISSGSDDGYSWGYNDLGWENHGLDLENIRFGGAGNASREYVASLMFRDIAVPAGEKIISAKLIFTNQTYQNEGGTIDLDITALDPNNTDTFSAVSMAQDRATLPEVIIWNKSNIDEESIDISTLVQSIVNSASWQSGGAMGFKISNSSGEGTRHNFHSFDSAGESKAPKIQITYATNLVPTTDPVDPVDPVVVALSDQSLDSGEDLNIIVELPNDAIPEGLLHWTKDYGPDGVNVHPLTGQVSWDINPNMPSDSFHVGLKVSGDSETIYTNFIVHVNKSQVLTVGDEGDYPNIKLALKALQSGGTIVVLDGTYTGSNNFIGLTSGGAVQHPPSGTSLAYTTIMAKHPSLAVLEDGAYIRLHGQWPVSYVSFKGLFVKGGQMAVFGYGANKSESNDRHHHIKFIRNGVQGGLSVEDSGDTKSPFNAFRCDDILFENNYTFGGGRYKFTSYQSSNVVWRRNVARYDRGTHHGEPKGTYSVYSTMDAFLANNLAIDGDDPEFVNQGELAGEFATPTTIGDTRAWFHRNMQINSAFLFGNMDDQMSGGGGDSDVEHTDMVSWDIKPYSRYVLTWGSAWFNHMTMGDVAPRNFADHFFFGYHNNTRGLTNSILHNFSNGDMFSDIDQEDTHVTVGRTVERYGVDTVNITDFSGVLNAYNSDIINTTAVSPLYSNENLTGGLKYLTRIESDSNLSGLGNDGADLGATVMTLLGESGTLFGEPGYNQETEIPMWPFPMEHIIKQKFSEYSYTGKKYQGHYTNRIENGTGTIEGARGFAVQGQSLTNYVWGYLGNVVPPFNVTASINNDDIVIQWDPSAKISQDLITAYKIYSYNPDTGLQSFIAQVSSMTYSYNIESVTPGSNPSFIVTALVNTKESGASFPVTVNN